MTRCTVTWAYGRGDATLRATDHLCELPEGHDGAHTCPCRMSILPAWPELEAKAAHP